MATRLLLASVLVWLSTAANAVIITMDADDFAAGTDVSHQIPGLTLAAYTIPFGSSSYSPIISGISIFDCVDPSICGSRTGGRQFGVTGSNPQSFSSGNFGSPQAALLCEQGTTFWCDEGPRTLDLRFDRPTDFLSLDTHWLSDTAGFIALNAAGAVVATCVGLEGEPCARATSDDGFGGHYSLIELMRPERDISRIIFGGRFGAARVGQISVSVPEPSTLLLLAAGLVGIGLARRRRLGEMKSSIP